MKNELQTLYETALALANEHEVQTQVVQGKSTDVDFLLTRLGNDAIQVILAASKENKEKTTEEIAKLMISIFTLMGEKGIHFEDLNEKLKH